MYERCEQQGWLDGNSAKKIQSSFEDHHSGWEFAELKPSYLLLACHVWA